MRLINSDSLWYTSHPLRWILWPLSVVYEIISILRRKYLCYFCQQTFPIPIIIVGNLTVGGVGKTPLVIALAQRLQARGLRVGIVSRGYGSRIKKFPHEVSLQDSATCVGDEPWLIAKKTGCPVIIAPSRTKAAHYLINKYQSEVIISDDGLQHYAMGRAIEIAVVDGVRGFGNGLCLPAGPLRERPTRLKQVDFVVVNGGTWNDAYRMDLHPGELTSVKHGHVIKTTELSSSIAAVAGIGHPKRFFETLKSMGIQFKSYAFPDHHKFKYSDFQLPEKDVVMTEKDAVKCIEFATDHMYFLPVDAMMHDGFWDALCAHKHLQGYV